MESCAYIELQGIITNGKNVWSRFATSSTSIQAMKQWNEFGFSCHISHEKQNENQSN